MYRRPRSSDFVRFSPVGCFFGYLHQLVNVCFRVQLGFIFGVCKRSKSPIRVSHIVPKARFPGSVLRDLQHVAGIRREDHVLAVADLPVDVALDLVGPAVRVVPEDHLPVSLHVLFPVRKNHDARPSGRFFLTIPGIRVYNSIRRSLRPSGDPVLNGNPSFCVAGGFVLYVYVVSVLINHTRFAGRFFLTIPLRLAYSSRRGYV